MARRAIANFGRIRLNHRIVRFVNLGPRLAELLAEERLTDQEIQQVIGRVPELNPSDFLDGPFMPKRYKPPYGDEGRFSDGYHPVFYSAEDGETARAESAHQVRKHAEARGAPSSREYLDQHSCDFSGDAKDLTRTGWPELTGDTVADYADCQDLGRQAVGEDLDGFRTLSARRSGGVCTPVFARRALSNAAFEGRVTIQVDVPSGAYKVEPV